MDKMKGKAILAAAVSAALLYGCSGGGNGSSTAVVPVPDTSPLTGYFVDAPVSGANYATGGMTSTTGDKGAFTYNAGAEVSFSIGSMVKLGSASGKSVISPLDLVPAGADPRIVQAIASLLQSLDADGDQSNGIQITKAIVDVLESKLAAGIDFTTWDEKTADELTALLTALASVLQQVGDETDAVYVPPEQAYDEMLADLGEALLEKTNASMTPEAATDKAGLDLLGVVVPARKADGSLVDGLTEVQPLVGVYADGVGANGEDDPFVAVSYDNGMSWKRTNLFRKAGREMTISGVSFAADSGGPSMVVEGNHLLVTWVSSFCQGGPDYVVDSVIDAAAVNPARTLLGDADPDWFKVLGKQGTVTYTFDNGTSLTNPYHCVWAARGVVAEDTGEITWRAPEQLTSGTRDAKIDTPAGMEGQGFAIAWQEDPEGLLPGEGEGPGVGWSGATTHHKTDVWYSFLSDADFEATAEEVVLDESDPTDTRLKVAKTFSVPAPVSNNNSCRLDSSGTIPAYCDTNLAPATPFCVSEESVTVQLGGGATDTGRFCVTEWGDVLDGDTGASRPNLDFATVLDDSNNVVGARALLLYEETKGLCEEGHGCPDAPYDVGKLIMYHHMPDFSAPQMVQRGDLLSQPVTTATTDPLLDPVGYPAPAEDPATLELEGLYENARRERFVVNSDPTNPVKMVVIYKQGWYNQGERADIFARRAIGGYDISNFGPDMCVSCVRPTVTELTDTGDYTSTTKVVEWDWNAEYVNDESWTNPYDDARSLRAKLDGDRLLIAYGWTPNWKLTTTLGGDGFFKDHFNFMVRRSYQAAAADNTGVFFELPIDTSNLKNNQENVVEPRLVTVADSILNCTSNDARTCTVPAGAPSGSTKFVVTYCTGVNTERSGADGRPVHAPGLDCFYSWSVDNGETFVADRDDLDGDGLVDFDCLACENDLEEVEPEVVLSEDGMAMHTLTVANQMLDEDNDHLYDMDEDGVYIRTDSDAWYRRFELAPVDTTTP